MARNSSKIGFWSTDYSQNTGQALVTRRVVDKVLPKLGEVRCYVFFPSGRPTAIRSWVGSAFRVWRDSAMHQVDTIYLVCSRSNAGFLRDIPALLLSRKGLRVVVHSHGSDIVSLLNGRLISPLARWTYRHCELVVPSAHLIPALSGTRLAALHVCENFSRVASGKTAHLAHKQGLLILWNSNVMASKGVFDLFEAVRSLKRRGVTINLKVIGRVLADEELTKPKAEAFLAEAIADGTIDFLGAVSSEEATSLLSASDVVALPSRYTSELQPLALIEAMCAGCAIVAADTQALRATLGGYPAEIVAVRSIEDIVNSLDRLVANKAFDPKAFASNLSHSAVKAQKRFSVRRFDQTLANILEDTSDRIEQ